MRVESRGQEAKNPDGTREASRQQGQRVMVPCGKSRHFHPFHPFVFLLRPTWPSSTLVRHLQRRRRDSPDSYITMPLKTLLACAVAGAAAGAAATSAYLTTMRKGQKQDKTPPPNPTQTPSSATIPTPTTLPPPQTVERTLSRPPILPVDPNGLFQYGFPGPVTDLRNAPSLTSCFDRRTRNPHWVAEHITPASLALSDGDRKHSEFHEDATIPQPFRAKLHDYFRSGYDRGHQVPAADANWSQDAMDATFALSNMCPQVGNGFNRDYWAHFEGFCRRLTQTYPSVRIVTGPLYLPRKDPDGKWRVSYEMIGNPPNVAVPTHFFKVILAEDGNKGGDVSVGAFVLPNAPIENERPLQSFEVPVGIVERASGLEFASLLPPERRKRLCYEVKCGVEIKGYRERQRSFGKGGSPK